MMSKFRDANIKFIFCINFHFLRHYEGEKRFVTVYSGFSSIISNHDFPFNIPFIPFIHFKIIIVIISLYIIKGENFPSLIFIF